MKIPKSSKDCILCKDKSPNELELGALKMTKNLRAHYYCLLFSETITQSGTDQQGILGFLASDITKEVNRSQKQICVYCKKPGATAGCVNKFCNKKFHLPCGIANNTQQNYNNFTSYCHVHRKPSNIPVRMRKYLTDYKCVVCLEYFEADVQLRNIIWASCCKSEIILHLNCIRQLALSAGYFTKCPGCNNNTDFITCIKFWGVFVPEKDASWEEGENAFSELYETHNKCDVSTCLCPDGRTFSMAKGKWKLVLCHLCGSYGTHNGCSQFKNKFLCDICDIVKKPSNKNSTTNANRTNEGNQRYNTRFIATRRSCIEQPITKNNNIMMEVKTERRSIDDTLLLNERNEKIKEIDTTEEEINVVDSDNGDNSGDVSLQNENLRNFTTIENITNEKASTSLSSNKLPSQNRPERRVAMKSTTKLPHSYKNLIKPENGSFCNNDDNERRQFVNNTDHNYFCVNGETASLKSHENKFSEKSMSLEKHTINSLDDDSSNDNVIDLDLYPDDIMNEPKLSNVSTFYTSPTGTKSQPLPSSNNIVEKTRHISSERRVALKSTTKQSLLKRKVDHLGNIPTKQFYSEKAESPFSQEKYDNQKTETNSAKRFKPILRRSPVTRAADRINDLSSLVFGNEYRNYDTSSTLSYSFRNVEMEDRKPLLRFSNFKENTMSQKLSLDGQNEVEIVHSPKFAVSTKEPQRRDASLFHVVDYIVIDD